MRFRRETGDFEIKLTSANSYTAKLNNRLSAEDLIGQVAIVDGEYKFVSSAKDAADKSTVEVTIGTDKYTYTKETALLTKKA